LTPTHPNPAEPSPGGVGADATVGTTLLGTFWASIAGSMMAHQLPESFDSHQSLIDSPDADTSDFDEAEEGSDGFDSGTDGFDESGEFGDDGFGV
jgi:hypothetical protein